MRKKKYSKNGCEDMAADGSIVIVADLDDRKAQAELNRLARRIDSLGEKIRQDSAARLPLLEQAERLGIQLDAAKAKLAEMQAAASGAYSSEQIADQKETVKALQTQWDAVQKQVEGYDRSIANSTAKLEAAEVQAGQLTARLTDTGEAGETAGQETAAGFNFASTALGKLERRIVGLAKRVFIFSVITKALRGLRASFVSVIQANDEAANAIGQLKAALRTLAYPIMQTVIPALTWLINVLLRVVSAVATFVAALFGMSAAEAASAAEAYYNEQQAIEGVGSAAQKAEKQLAGFDEINKLTADGGGGGSTSGGAIKPLFGPGFSSRLSNILSDVDFSAMQAALDRLHESFSGLASIIGGALRQVWNEVLKPLGTWTIEQAAPRMIELLATGFDLLRAVLSKLAPILYPIWEKLLKPFFAALGKIVLKGLDELIDLLGDFVDLIDGNISWNEFLNGLTGVQVALLSLGGLAVLNAIGSVVSGIASIPASIAKNIPVVVANLSKLAKVVATGALAVFDGMMIAYDVKSLKEASDTYLAAQEAINRDIDTAMRAYAAIYEKNGKEAADAFALATYHIDLSGYNFLEAQQKLKEAIEAEYADVPRNLWQGFKAGWNEYFGENGRGLLALLSDAFNSAVDGIKNLLGIHSPSTVFEDIGTNMVQGLWNGFSSTWDKFSDWLSNAWDGVAKWWDGLSLDFKREDGSISASSSKIRDKIPKIPALAQGAVIPPNREFLAVLGDQKSGTNIEAPLETIVAAFRQALSERRGGNQTVILQIDKHELGRVTYDAYNTESQRVGIQLGGALT